MELRDPVDALLDAGQHPEPEQVDLEEPSVGARVLVPLAELAACHRRGLDGDELDERPGRDHHPARVLGDVPRQPCDLSREELESAPSLREELLLRVGERRDLVGHALRVPAVGHAGEPLELGVRQPERLADVADRAARAVRREARDERSVLVPVALGDADDQLLADVAREVEVDVRHRQRAPRSGSGRARGRSRPGRRARARSGSRRSSRRSCLAPAPAAGTCAASRGRAPRARTPARARAPRDGGGRSRRARASRSAPARRPGGRGLPLATVCCVRRTARRTHGRRSRRAGGSRGRRGRRSRDSGSRAPR